MSEQIPPTSILHTPKIYLRPYEETDTEAIAHSANDPEIARWLRSRFPSPYTIKDGEEWISLCRAADSKRKSGSKETTTMLQFGVFALPSGELAGSIGLEAPKGDPIYSGTRELGYYCSRKFWGRGIMSEAVREFTRWAFATLPELLRIEAGVFEGNEGSKRVLSKAGFVKEGSRRMAAVKDGKVISEDIFGLVRTDIEA
ncbi:acetyltransferase [Poronia punctata]|nr:acetyltransferase [Poronia punctata]